MEAHPPCLLPEGLRPSGLPAFKCWGTPPYRLPVGLHPSGLPACGGCASIMGLGPSPWPPSWKEGGNYKKSWGTPPDPCQRGCSPLDSPLASAGAHPPCRLPEGLHLSGLPACTCWGTPPDPCQRGCSPLDSPLARAGGHPQTPARGVVPLWTPCLHVLGDTSIPLARGVAPLWTPRLHVLGDTSIPLARGVAPLWTLPACTCGRWASRGPRRSAGGT